MSADERRTLVSMPNRAAGSPFDFLVGGGEMGERIRALDWNKTPLGPAEQWPQSLWMALRIMLASRQPIWVGWGPELIYFYNDPYKSIIGGRHPWALGQPTRDVWRELWGEIGPMLETAMGGDQGTYVESQLLIMERNGYPEETYYTFSYSPIPKADGTVGGIFCANSDDTQRVIGERQLALLRDLAAQTAHARSARELCMQLAQVLRANSPDLPFAMLYMAERGGTSLTLECASGIERGHEAAPDSLPADAHSLWPAGEALRAHQTLVVSDLQRRIGAAIPAGPWSSAPTQAAVVPIPLGGESSRTGVLIVGLNPFRLFDTNYRSFLTLVAGQIAAAIANAQAYEQERHRAEALAEIDRAKTVFFSNVSHEFRTPLTLILGPLEEAAADPAIAAPLRSQLDRAYRNSLRLLKLVNTLLDFSRIEAGRMQASYEPTDLDALTRDLASTFRSAIERAALSLTVNCNSIHTPVYVDREMWEKIVLNLLSNAFKYTLKGGISVRLSAEGEHAILEVADTGTGIPEHELPHVFERFHRVSGAVGRTQEGSGIGLALVQELVKLHGGTVEVASTVGQGTTFRVRVPFGITHLPAEHIKAQRPLSSTAVGAQAFIQEALRWLPEANASSVKLPQLMDIPPSVVPHRYARGAGSRIVLADDNADMRAYVADLLAPYYRVEAVENGLQALAAARRRRPEMIVSDIMMAGMDGLALLKSLRSDDSLQDVPVILLSARAGEEARIEGMDAGADDYLIKPFSARELLARVGALLELTQLRRESKARLQLALSSIRDQFFVLDERWRFILVNPKVSEIAGLAEEELLRQSLFDVFPDLRGTLFETELTAVVKTLQPRRFEFQYPLSERWFETAAYPAAEGVAVLVADITERKRTEQLALEQSKLLELVASGQPLTECLIALTEAIGRLHVSARICVTLADQIRSNLAHSFASSIPSTFGDGLAPEQDVLACYSQPVLDVSGETVASVIMCFDQVREASDWERRIASFGAHVASIAIERDRAMAALRASSAERELLLGAERTARADAESANRLKDEFLATLSHELRTPLSNVVSWSRLLQKKYSGDDEHVRRGLAIIVDNALSQAQVISDLLDMSRIVSGKVQLELEPRDLAQLVESTVAGHRPAAEAKRIRLEMVPMGEPLLAQLDAARMRQVLWNLLSNAVKFTPEGGQVDVQLQRVEARAQLKVRDTGIGIVGEFLPHVFERFRQADSSTGRRFGGLGLGLAIVKQIVELHGGAVRAYSEGEGRGATFTVEVPLLSDADSAVVAAGGLGHAPEILEGQILKGMRILAVEDDGAMLELLSRVLGEYGAELTSVSSAAAALEILRSGERFDLLLSDLGLSPMDGFTFLRKVRAQYPDSDLPAIALTAFSRDEDRARAVAAGFQGYLTKPYEVAKLVALARRLGTIHTLAS